MNFLKSESTPLPGEIAVSTIGEIATRGLSAYADEAKRTFELLWSDPDSIQDKLNRMGNMAALAFAQHYDTVTHLLRSFARGAFAESGTSSADLTALLQDPPTWLLTHPEHPLAGLVLAKMPPASWMPPAEYSINADGTVTLK